MSSLIRQNGASPTPPAASSSSGSSTSAGGYSFGSFALSGTAALMSEILKLLQELCQIENLYSELTKTDISEGSAAAAANAQSTLSAGNSQAEATADQAWAQFGSALSNAGGLAAMGVATYKYSGVNEIDNQLNVNKNVTAQVDRALTNPSTEEFVLSGESAPAQAGVTQKTLTARQETLVDSLKKGSFGTEGSRSLAGYTDEDYECALGYIKKTDGEAALKEIQTRAGDNTDRLNTKKDSILRQRDQLSQAGNTFAQIGSSIANTSANQCASQAQKDQASEEADKAYSQASQGIAQSAQQQAVSARDNKDQQVSQTLQLIQSAVAANQIN